MAPYLSIFGLDFRTEMILLPTLFGVLLLRRFYLGLAIPSVIWLLLALWLWLFTVSAIGIMSGVVDSVLLINAYAFVRPILIVLIFFNLDLSHDDAWRLLRYFAYTAIPLGLLSIGQSLGIPLAIILTVEGYTSAFRTSVANLLEATGTILRSTSIFESPVYAAVYFLLALGTALLWLMVPPEKLNHKQRLFLIISVLCAAVGGLLTLSSTFFAGISLLIIWLMFRLPIRRKIRFLLISIVFAVLLAFIVSLLGSHESRLEGSLSYQVSRIVNLTLFDTRYDPERGFLANAIKAILERPLTGWGWSRLEDVFVGDSIYVVLAYYGGIIALGLFLIALFFIALAALRSGFLGEILLLWLVVFLATGLGSPSFFIPRLGEWWWALVGIALADNSRRRRVCCIK
jgi:hypothetical protein